MNDMIVVWILVGIVFLLIAPAMIGYYVYNDAKRKNNAHPMGWALIAGLFPLCIGLVMYIFASRLDQ